MENKAKKELKFTMTEIDKAAVMTLGEVEIVVQEQGVELGITKSVVNYVETILLLGIKTNLLKLARIKHNGESSNAGAEDSPCCNTGCNNCCKDETPDFKKAGDSI